MPEYLCITMTTEGSSHLELRMWAYLCLFCAYF